MPPHRARFKSFLNSGENVLSRQHIGTQFERALGGAANGRDVQAVHLDCVADWTTLLKNHINKLVNLTYPHVSTHANTFTCVHMSTASAHSPLTDCLAFLTCGQAFKFHLCKGEVCTLFKRRSYDTAWGGMRLVLVERGDSTQEMQMSLGPQNGRAHKMLCSLPSLLTAALPTTTPKVGVHVCARMERTHQYTQRR